MLSSAGDRKFVFYGGVIDWGREYSHASQGVPMRLALLHRACSIGRAAALASIVLAVAPAGSANAEDLLGLYLGGAVGQSRVDADGSSFNTASFRENHSAFKG